MNENLFQTQYDVTKKSKLKEFYQSNKILIFLTLIILIVGFVISIYLNELKDEKRNLLAEKYMTARLYLQNGEKNKAENIFKDLVLANDSTYSTLSLFIIINENLIQKPEIVYELFNHVLKNNKFEKEFKNLISFKKALYESNFVNESQLLDSLNAIINSDSLWKPHALLLLGDYFFNKKENLKAKEFYEKTLSLKNLDNKFYDQARFKLSFIND